MVPAIPSIDENVDDRSAPDRLHRPDDRPDAEEDAGQVDVENAVPL